jgi:hypothetical protein
MTSAKQQRNNTFYNHRVSLITLMTLALKELGHRLLCFSMRRKGHRLGKRFGPWFFFIPIQILWQTKKTKKLRNNSSNFVNFNFARKFDNSILGSCSFVRTAETRVRVRIRNFLRGEFTPVVLSYVTRLMAKRESAQSNPKTKLFCG